MKPRAHAVAIDLEARAVAVEAKERAARVEAGQDALAGMARAHDDRDRERHEAIQRDIQRLFHTVTEARTEFRLSAARLHGRLDALIRTIMVALGVVTFALLGAISTVAWDMLTRVGG